MVYLINPSTEPAFNLALEEYLLKEKKDEYLMLWRDRPAVICGRNQNIFEETDICLAERHGVAVLKRFSGGGAVYHDTGCINYTLIIDDPSGTATYEKLTRPIIDALRAMGIAAYPGASGAINVNGKKVSGGAEARHRDRVLHHGTLLYSTDLDALEQYAGRKTGLNTRSGVIESRSVKSSVAGVVNLSELLPTISADKFMVSLEHFLNPLIAEKRELTDEERRYADALAINKYSTWEWNLGTSPRFNFCGVYRGEEIAYSAYHGIIDKTSPSLSMLVGCRLERKSLETALKNRSDAAVLSEFIVSGREPQIP